MTRDEIAAKFVAAFPTEVVMTTVTDDGAVVVHLHAVGKDDPHTMCTFAADSAESAVDKAVETIKANAA